MKESLTHVPEEELLNKLQVLKINEGHFFANVCESSWLLVCILKKKQELFNGYQTLLAVYES